MLEVEKGCSCRTLDEGDYESAAEHVSEYLGLEKRFGDVTDELDSRQLKEQQQVLLIPVHCSELSKVSFNSTSQRLISCYRCHG